MKNSLLLILFSLVVCLLPKLAYASGFSAGNIVVYRVGTGAEPLVNTGNAVYIDEYTAAGALVQSLSLPTTTASGQAQLIASGLVNSEGLLTRSADGRYLLLTGYAADTGGSVSLSSSAASVISRSVGRIDWGGAIDTSTALNDFASNSSPRSAVSSDGNNIWLTGGVGGIRFTTFGADASIQINASGGNFRQMNIFDDQLYASAATGSRLAKVGSGLPTTGNQTITVLPGITNSGSPFAYFFADLDAGVAGVDTLYVADEGTLGLAKYALVGGSWSARGKIGGDSDDYRGLTGVVNGSSLILYATRKGGSDATGGGELVVVTDHSGYNGVLNATPFVLATAAANTAMRGVALAPVAAGAAPEIAVTGNDLTIDNGDSTPSPSDGSNLGSVDVLSGSWVQTFTIRNMGEAALTVSAINLSGVAASDFRLSGLTLPATIDANGNAAFQITFDPSAWGVRNALLTIANNDSNENPYTFVLQGLGLAPEIGVLGNGISIVNGDAQPDTVDGTDFALVTVGLPLTRTFTISNNGNSNLVINNVSLSGAGAFRVISPVTPIILSAGSTLTFQVACMPSAVGVLKASLSIESNDNDENPYVFAIQGQGVVPEIDVQGNGLSIVSGDGTPNPADDTDFGVLNVLQGVTRTFTIKNIGLGSLVIDNLTFSGAAAGDFAVSGIVTPALVNANSSITFQLTMTAMGSGVRSAMLEIVNNDNDETSYSFALQGVGLKLTQTIVFNAPSSRVVYGAPPFTLDAMTSSGLPVSLTVVSGPAALNGTTMTITGAGVILLRASQAGNDLYHPALSVERTINVAKAPLTITVENKSMAYGAALPVFTATYSGFVNGEMLANLDTPLTLTTPATSSSLPGVYLITASNATDANYAVTFVNGTLTIIGAPPLYLPLVSR